jgi:hypothetical protein
MKLSKSLGAVALGVALIGIPSIRAFGEDVQYKTITRDDMPKEARHEADAQTRGGSDVQYQRQSRDGKTFYSIHWTKDGKRMEARLDDQGKVVSGPFEARNQPGGAKETAAKDDDAGVKFRGISANDVPSSVKRTMDKYTDGSRDLQYQSQLREGKTFYSVHYTTRDNKRMFVRIDDKGQLALGPVESSAQKPRNISPDAAKTTAKIETKREAINVDQLPAAVRKTVETATGGGTDHTFVKQTRGEEVTYVVEYNKNGSRTSALIDPEGKIIEGEAFAAAPPTPAPAPTPTPPDTAVKNASEAELAAAREQANAPYLLLSSADQLPAQVRAAAEKEMAGGTNPMFQRYIANGQTAYSVYFSNDKGRQYMAIDQSGKVLVEPRKSKWQEGGKAATFEALGADQLPAEVRKTIEAQHGSAHVFVKRTTANGRVDYLTQYTDAAGQRMEAEISAEGKLVGKARKAEEQPLTSLEKKKG